MLILPKTKLNLKEFDFNEVTNSARTCFTQCRRKFYWSYICRLTPNVISKPLFIGSLFHFALENFYKKEKDLQTILNEVDEKIDIAAQECIDSNAADELWKQGALIKGMIEGYYTFYQRDLKEWKIIAPETKFRFKLRNGWYNTGMRDLLIQNKKKELILVEHKTTSFLDANYIAKLPLDSQIMSYAISCKYDLKQFPKSIIYNVVKKSGLKWKQTETLEQYAMRLKQEYLQTPSNYFYREIISFSKEDLLVYEKDLNLFAIEMQRAIKEQYYYCNYAHCTVYGICPFMALCTAKTSKAFNEAILSYRVKEAAHEELA